MDYRAPLKDMLFTIEALGHLAEVSACPAHAEIDADTVRAVLEESARFNEEIVAPLNRVGDREPPRFANGEVTTTPGFAEAFRAFAAGGWQGLHHPVEYGGQGLPKLVQAACVEMVNGANLSFALCPMLTDGAIEALLAAGSEAQKRRFIPPMIEGRWTGTMNLTEPQAGSDLAMVRTRAEPRGDGSWRISGTKIYITWGQHDMAENIVHLVLARIAGAPEGVKGISLFLVPKRRLDDDGSDDGPPGAGNGVQCLSIEHKLGIHASPTAVLQFGGEGGAAAPGGEGGSVGWLVGEENRGLETMFVMMNASRFAVGLQGVGIAERAYQKAVAYARERVQSRPVDGSQRGAAAIVHHPDVKRMLLSMRAIAEGGRAMAAAAAAADDLAHAHLDAAVREEQRAFNEFLVPLVKGWSTETALDAASLGVQVHGGMGFVEETGAAQYLRDAKILSIYEGTTAIQANDLVGRKTLRDGGRAARAVSARIEATEGELARRGGADLAAIGRRLADARRAFDDVVRFVLEKGAAEPNAVFAGSVPYLMLVGGLVAGWQLARAAIVAQQRLADGVDAEWMRAKIATARFFADHLLTRSAGLRESIVEGHAAVEAMAVDAF